MLKVNAFGRSAVYRSAMDVYGLALCWCYGLGSYDSVLYGWMALANDLQGSVMNHDLSDAWMEFYRVMV
jgi:hypothetical protein